MRTKAASPLAPPLTALELRRFERLGAPLPRAWTTSVRRRRLMLLGLAAPGFLAIADTPAHQNFFALVAGLLAFAAAFIFRRLTEPVFVRAEAAALWPPAADLPSPAPERTRPMRSRITLTAAGAVLALTLLAPPPAAHAQMAVIDLKAIAQAQSQVQNQLTAINNQLVQIQRLESQLSNQALMLQKMQTDVTGPILSIENQATQILQNAQGVGYGAQNVAQTFANLYPSTMPGASLQTTQASLAAWRANNTAAIQAALQAQNQIVQNQGAVTTQVQTAVAASQGASGQTGAIQAGNQLLAAATKQLTDLQNLLITQARAQQLLAAQAQASQAAGLADSQRFWTSSAPASRVQNPGTL